MFIYKTVNQLNGHYYIGKTIKAESVEYFGSGNIIRRALKKNGKQNFTREILERCSSLEELAKREKYFIELYDATNDPLSYNIASGGNGGHTGNYEAVSRGTAGSRNGMYGKRLPQESIDKAIKKRKETRSRWTDEQKKTAAKNASLAQKGNPKNPKSIEKMKRSKYHSAKSRIPRVRYDVWSPIGDHFHFEGKRELSKWCKDQGFSIWIMDHYLLCEKEVYSKNPLFGWRAKSRQAPLVNSEDQPRAT